MKFKSNKNQYKGVRINSPHYLVKLVDDCSSPITYTLVIAQYEKNNTVYYTLRAYSTLPFKMNELKEPYNPKYTKKVNLITKIIKSILKLIYLLNLKVVGKWDRNNAGGCSNNQETYKNNPLYQINLNNNSALNCIKIELKGPQ
jgi:calpain-7